MADEGLLRSVDVPQLPTGSSTPVVTAISCALNRFSVPGFESLGQQLVRSGGALAVWSASGLSVHGQAKVMADSFVATIYGDSGQPSSARLGDAVLQALEALAVSGNADDVLAVYNLLGEPVVTVE